MHRSFPKLPWSTRNEFVYRHLYLVGAQQMKISFLFSLCGSIMHSLIGSVTAHQRIIIECLFNFELFAVGRIDGRIDGWMSWNASIFVLSVHASEYYWWYREQWTGENAAKWRSQLFWKLGGHGGVGRGWVSHGQSCDNKCFVDLKI